MTRHLKELSGLSFLTGLRLASWGTCLHLLQDNENFRPDYLALLFGIISLDLLNGRYIKAWKKEMRSSSSPAHR